MHFAPCVTPISLHTSGRTRYMVHILATPSLNGQSISPDRAIAAASVSGRFARNF